MVFILGSKNTSKTGVATEGLPSSEERVTNPAAKRHQTETNKTQKNPTPQPRKPPRFVTRVGNVSQLRKVRQGAMNSAFALSTSSSRHYSISTRKGCSTYSQQSQSYELFVRGLLQPGAMLQMGPTRPSTAVVHKENPAGRAIAKLLATFELEPDHHQRFTRPVGREEAEANTASTVFDIQASHAAPVYPWQSCCYCHHGTGLGPKDRPIRRSTHIWRMSTS